MKTSAYIIALSLIAFSSTAQAQDKSSFLSFSLGYYDILDNDEALDFRLEYRSGHSYWWKVKPWAGIELTSDASLWAGGGILADIEVADQLYLVPSFGLGYYARGSSDLNLGHAIEFRSQIELDYELENKNRLGVSFSHSSNASLNSDNPGVESLNLYYHVPLDSLGL